MQGLSNSYALLGYDIISQRGYPVYQTSNPRVNPDQQGASEYFTIFNKYTLELRYPFALNPSSTIYAETFFEAANGWYTFQDYNPFRLRRSVGAGCEVLPSYVWFIGFDYGVGLDVMDPNDQLKRCCQDLHLCWVMSRINLHLTTQKINKSPNFIVNEKDIFVSLLAVAFTSTAKLRNMQS